jgi:hypothetical protein
MGRLFTFGCSFTTWEDGWDTWADIISRDNFSEYKNYGRIGAGNQYIFTSLIEAIKRDNITQADTVMVMWTSVTRHDYWFKGSWQCRGNILTSRPNLEWMKRFYDIDGFYFRDLPLITAGQLILDSIGCKQHVMSMVDIGNHDQFKLTTDNSQEFRLIDLFDAHSDTTQRILPSVHNVIFNYDYNSRPLSGLTKREGIRVCHPFPSEHLEYIETVLPEYEISDQTRAEVLNQDNQILKSLEGDWAGTRHYMYDVPTEVQQFDSWREDNAHRLR